MKGQALGPSWTKQWDGSKENIIKERGRKRESFRERDSTFYLNFSEIGLAVSSEEEEEFILTARASHRDRNRGVLTNSKR